MAPVDGTYIFGATPLYKINACGRLVLNGTTEIRVSRGEISGAHVSQGDGAAAPEDGVAHRR